MTTPESINWNITRSQLLATGHELYYARPEAPDEEICGVYPESLQGGYEAQTRPAAVYWERVGRKSELALWLARCMVDLDGEPIIQRPSSPIIWQQPPTIHKTSKALIDLRAQMRAERAMAVSLPSDRMLCATVDERFYETGLLPRPEDCQQPRQAKEWYKPDITPQPNVGSEASLLFPAQIITFPKK